MCRQSMALCCQTVQESLSEYYYEYETTVDNELLYRMKHQVQATFPLSSSDLQPNCSVKDGFLSVAKDEYREFLLLCIEI